MGLSDIAAGIEVTATQEEQGVATVDATDATLAERLGPFAEALPCAPAPTTAAKTLHLLGENVSPAGPTGSEVVRDWIAGELTRTEAMELSRLGEQTFALAAFVETHEPLEAACAAVEGVLAGQRALAETTSDATDLL